MISTPAIPTESLPTKGSGICIAPIRKPSAIPMPIEM